MRLPLSQLVGFSPTPESLHALLEPVSLAGFAVCAVAAVLAEFRRGFVGFGASMPNVMVRSVVLGQAPS